MRYYDICTRKEYKQGEETKVQWLKCGTMRETDAGKKFIELNHMPDTTLFVFEPKPKEQPADSGFQG